MVGFTSACVKFVVVVFVSSARWVMSVAGMVESLIGVAGRVFRVADVGRVEEVQLDVHCG